MMGTELAVLPTRAQSEPRNDTYQVIDPIPVLDTARFEHMQRIAMAMASTSWVPDALCKEWNGKYDGNKKVMVLLPTKEVIANCFLVVNQAVRWGMDPFAVAQCVSLVHGKLCYEGKLIAAVIDAKLGVKLVPEYNDKTGDAFGVKIYGVDENGSILQNPATNQPLTIEGTVGDWKTTGEGSPWGAQKNHARQLMYRGSREWARFYRPAILLGVYAPDEMEDLSSTSRSSAPRVRSEAHVPPPPPPVDESQTPALEHAPGMTMPEIAEDTREPAPVQETETPATGPLTPPPPPPAPPAEPERKPAAALDDSFEAVKKRFATAIAFAMSREQLGVIWDEVVAPFEPGFMPPDREELDKMYRYRKAEIADIEEADGNA